MPRSALQPSLVLAATAACAVTQPVDAAEWSMQPTLQTRVDFNTNRRLQVTKDSASAGLWLTLDPSFARSTETGDITFRPRAELQRYSQDTALDTANTSFQLAGRHLGERYGFSAQAGYSRDSTLTTELAETGIIATNTHRKTLSGSVSGAFNVSVRQQISVQASYANIEYPNGARFGLVGYRYPSVSGTYTYSLTPLTGLSLTAFGDLLSAPDSDYRAREQGIRIGMDRSLSERLRLSASAGLSRTHTDEQGFFFFGFFIPTSPERTEHGAVWSLRLTQLGELLQWSLAYDRNVQPSGAGALVRRDTVNIASTRHVSPRLNATLSLQLVGNEELSRNGRRGDRKYLTGDAGLEWKMSTRTVLMLTAGYSEARLSFLDERATAWRSVLGIRWTPSRWSTSQ